MNSIPIVTSLWDYGWIRRDLVNLAVTSSDAVLIDQYVASPAFHLSFLPSNKDEKGIHGPFLADRIQPIDFIPLLAADLEPYVETIGILEDSADDAAERAKIVSILRTEFEEGRKCFVLRRDERNLEFFHEWGFVLFIFREFLFLNSRRDGFVRIVIGYD